MNQEVARDRRRRRRLLALLVGALGVVSLGEHRLDQLADNAEGHVSLELRRACAEHSELSGSLPHRFQ